MLDNQIFNWTLTGVLLATCAYHALMAVSAPRFVGKTNNTLHAIMGLCMAATLWRQGQWATLSAVLLLSSGALWFVIQAVARPEFGSVCTEKNQRTKCIYHGITMAAGAYMVAAMAPAPLAGHVDAPAAAPTPSHHMASGIQQSIPTSSFDLAPLLDGGAVIFFGAAALIFAALIARSFKGTSHLVGRTTLNAPHRPALGFEALSAGAMAAMYLAMLP